MARRHAHTVIALRADYVDAPVSGGTIGAQQGTLSIRGRMHPGELGKAKEVFECLGKTTP